MRENDAVKVLSPSGKRFILFTAPWCGACKTRRPTIEQAFSDAGIAYEELNFDEHKPLAAEHGIKGIPSILVLAADGTRLARVPGGLVTSAVLKRFSTATQSMTP